MPFRDIRDAGGAKGRIYPMHSETWKKKSTVAAAMVGYLALAVALTGCGHPRATFEPVAAPGDSLPGAEFYDTDSDGQADLVFEPDHAGRLVVMSDLRDSQGPPRQFPLDVLPGHVSRHLVIILDGVGYDVLAEYYRSGGLRLFHPPSRVIAPYPTLTDLCLEDLLDYIPCLGFEAEYYDRSLGQVVGGARAYLRGLNQPYNALLDYRSNLLLDAVGYVKPWWVFRRELGNLKRTFDRRNSRQVIGYVVSSAGISTDGGAAAQRQMLKQVDLLTKQLTFQTGGLVDITLLADHGHSYTPGKRIELEDFLRKRGWRLTESLREPNDVAYIRFGLETYASFACDRPARLAVDLVEADGVELASYAAGRSVEVLSAQGGRATIERRDGLYRYVPADGDPLEIAGALAALPGGLEGWHEADALLAATANLKYPAPLQRLWRAHFALVENPPDVIISLADGWYSGSRSLDRFVDVASTHGSLNRTNSTTFILSTTGPLPPLLRSSDVAKALSALLGEPFPARDR